MRRLLNCIGSRRSSIRCASFAAGLFHFKIVPEELFPFPTYNLEEDEADNLDTLTGKVKEGEKVDGLLAGARIAAEYGGLGLKNTAYCLACEEIGRRGADEELLFAIQSSSFPVHVLTAFGSKETKGKHLTLMSDGTERFGWAVQEDHGSDVSMNTTRARVENDKYILTGKKCCRPLPERATHFLVLARTKTQILGEDGPQESDRSSLFIVDRNAKGVRVEGESVVLEEVEVEAEDIVGTVGEGFRNYVIAHLTEQYALSATLLGTLKACCEEISKSGEDPHNNGILGSCIASIYMVESALHALTANLDRHVEDILLESCFTSSLIYQTAQKCFSMLSTVAPLSSTYYKSYTTLLRMMEHPDYLFGAGVTSGVEEYGLDFQQTSTLQIMIRRTGRMVGMRDKLPVREISGCEKIDKAIVNFGNAVETTFIQNTTSLPYQQLLVNRLGEAGALLYAASATASRAAYAVKKMQASAKAEKHLASVVIAGATDRVNVLCEAAQNTGMTADDICKRIALELCDEAAKGINTNKKEDAESRPAVSRPFTHCALLQLLLLHSSQLKLSSTHILKSSLQAFPPPPPPHERDAEKLAAPFHSGGKEAYTFLLLHFWGMRKWNGPSHSFLTPLTACTDDKPGGTGAEMCGVFITTKSV
eukprot:gene2203-1370_t